MPSLIKDGNRITTFTKKQNMTFNYRWQDGQVRLGWLSDVSIKKGSGWIWIKMS
ncbi:hypothetical protein HanXRQr2_Chr04g0175811 [Helianthus annuus]|uniref:Uncharacterized protein n=1 Tax=Helianthus annuus TaxID=4232 RepID=A0A9K3J9C2_HELAN|nr:hypothetical protein HanXRQr2_Chr04g0175811 [Helianthus annuus]